MEEMYRKQADEIIEQVKKELESASDTAKKDIENEIQKYTEIKNGITARTNLAKED